ncbi:MaoC family dehydratase N-terminal domain-containing protein [Chloroflexota bacterium]
MAEELVTDKLRECIGMQSEPIVIEIEKGMIRRFAEAIEDSNPLWQDEEYARNARYGGIVAPPGFLMTVLMRGGPAVEPPFEMPVTRVLDGGGQWEYFKPVRPGDVLTLVNKLDDIRERQGRMGTMVFLVNETTWKNQRNELVASCRSTLIKY